MQGEHDLTRETDVDLGSVFASLWRHKGKLLGAALLVTALTFVLLQVMSPRYRSEARILIRASESVLASPTNGQQTQTSDFDDPGIASQVQLLQSRDIARKIIADGELNLMKRPEFETGLDQSTLGSLLEMLGLTDNGGAVTAEDRVLDSYYDKLKVFQADASRVIVIQFSSKDKALAAKIPNLIAEEYMTLQEVLKRGAAPEELAKLEPELAEQRRLVEEAEAKVADFRGEADLQQGRDDDTLATQELSELATELGRVRAQLSRAEANADAVARALNGGSLDSASQVLASPLVQRLQERLSTLESDLSEQLTTLLPGHPRVQRLESQIDTLEQQIEAEARKIERSLEEEAQTARAREEDLVRRRNQLKSEAGRVDRAGVELRALEREADAQRQLLNTYLLAFKEAKSRQNREFLPADAFLFSRAEVQSKPYFPKKVPTLTGAFFGTLLLGSMIVLAGSILGAGASQTAARTSPMAKRKDIAEAPPIAPRLGDVSGPMPTPEDRAVPLLAAAQSLAQLGRSRVAVLSPQGDEGSVASIALARAIVAEGVHTVLVDATGEGASTAMMTGRSDLPGLRNLLDGSAAFADALHSDHASGLHILASGAGGQSSTTGMTLKEVLTALSETYDCVLVDCGAAGLPGLRQIMDERTVCVVNALQANDPKAIGMSAALQQGGYATPLCVRTYDDETELA